MLDEPIEWGEKIRDLAQEKCQSFSDDIQKKKLRGEYLTPEQRKLARVANALLRGETQRQISKRTGLSRYKVGKALCAVLEWNE